MSDSPPRRSGRSYHFALGIKFEHYEVESVPDALEVKLPSLFSLDYRHQIAVSVVLFDQRGNEFEVAATKRGCEIFLTHGWRQVGRCLGLNEGGWIKMIYVGEGRFFIEPRDRLHNPPFHPAPPRILRLNEEPRMASSPDSLTNFLDPSVYVARKPTVVMSFYATLQRSDLTTSYLHLPLAFCEVVFPKRDCDITLVDGNGKAWSCGLIFPPLHFHSDVLLRGWGAFADENEFPEGYAYKLDVPVESTNLMFFGGH